MTDITRLDDATISKIAAGEVIERPASVVKELVENSLDAGASRIEVTVHGGGIDLIRVADDGQGMSEEGVRRAVEQHTTSKIGSIDDLEAGVGTLGFRGEALHTIGAVSRLTIETRPQDGADVGTEVRVEGGEVTDLAPVGRAPGTTVTVADLFFNTPARRKYLKRESTEFGHVNRVVSRYSLANPDVAISLTHADHDVFRTPGSGDLQEAVLSVYGRDVAESMIEVDVSPDGPVSGVSGVVSDPETTRSGAEYVSTYVNGRYVRADSLRSAILDAYGKQLAADRYPFAVLFLSVPAETVDVNVHPRKMAVRFDDETVVIDAVTDA
ncbi:MAG: DNA mismatch repair endonuclease MutL, partial [Halodesulfurarchaeum sp.]|nr:DNA mismatch repair endonuclease MutL [Halodesulfurarchaeum sp.]